MRLFFVFSLMFLGVLFLPNFLFNFPGYIEGICCENSEVGSASLQQRD